MMSHTTYLNSLFKFSLNFFKFKELSSTREINEYYTEILH